VLVVEKDDKRFLVVLTRLLVLLVLVDVFAKAVVLVEIGLVDVFTT